MSSSYNWGAPQGQPMNTKSQSPSDNQPSNGASSQAASSKNPLIAGGAVLAILIIGFCGLWAFQNLRPTPTGPLGWSDEDVASSLPGGRITDCELNQEFWDSVGVKNVKSSNNGTSCAGWISVSGGGEIAVDVDTSGTSSPSSESSQSLASDGLEGWRKITSKSTSFGSYSPENTCTYYSNNYIFKGYLRIASTCEALDPIAHQIQNIQIQDDFARADRGLFDFSSPEYLEVSPSPVTVTSAYYESTAGTELQEGAPAPVADDDHAGSNIGFRGLRSTPDGVCADMTFTLGAETRDTFYFDIPPVAIVLPTGESISLSKQGSLSLNEGESGDVSFCGSVRAKEIIGSEAYVTTISPPELEQGNYTGGSWKVKAGDVSGAGNTSADIS